MAFEAIEKGGNTPCILNAANEVAVAAFLKGKIGFMDIPRIVEKSLKRANYINDITLQDLIDTNTEAVKIATDIL